MEITPVHFCDVTVDGERWPVFGWAIDHRDGTILVDTGMIDSTAGARRAVAAPSCARGRSSDP